MEKSENDRCSREAGSLYVIIYARLLMMTLIFLDSLRWLRNTNCLNYEMKSRHERMVEKSCFETRIKCDYGMSALEEEDRHGPFVTREILKSSLMYMNNNVAICIWRHGTCDDK